MSMPTDSQNAAIQARGNVLVSAGAGTGKTSTLVARALRIVFDENCDLDRILMVTFTEAAAAEMRQRLREELQKRLTVEGFSARAEEQLALLDTAPFGTLHSFCLRLVREHFHDLDQVDPQAVVLDGSQTRLLEATALETILDGHYAGGNEASECVREFIRRECQGSDDRVRALILRLHRYTQTLENSDGWMEQQRRGLEENDPVLWRRWLVEAFDEWRAFWLPRLREAQIAQPCYAAFANALAAVSNPPDLAGMRTVLASIHAANETDGGVWPARQVTRLRKPFEVFFKEADGFQTFALPSNGSDPMAEDWQHVRRPLATLLRLTTEFTSEFSHAKRELGGLDFADLEQFSLQLLRRPEIAARWQAQFEHVFVDEYQDINAAQDAILTALSREGAAANRFLVGDIKQSIYGFRLADPRIFQHYEREWSGDAGRCLPLSDNFRSREAVLEFVNRLFGALMRPVLGKMNYSQTAHLQFGRGATHPELGLKANPDAEPRVEFHIIQKTEIEAAPDDDNDDKGQPQAEVLDLARMEKEARLVALRLRKLRDEKRAVWNGKELKAVEWGDMVVLLRSVGPTAETYAKVFHELGVPLVARRGGFYEALEVMDLLHLLRLLDNPLQDLPLLAVLRSPLAGFSLDELVEIRTALPKASFWEALKTFHRTAKHDSSAWPKVDELLSRHTRWRAAMRQGSLSACLETALDETGYEAMLLAGERGAERAANVRGLLDLARQFDPYQRQGLYRFLRFVDEQMKLEEDRPPALPAQTDNAVRLMTIHQSKGLEFPVVVLADLGRQFNEQDLRSDILLSDEFHLCMKVLPPHAEQRYECLPLWLARRRERGELRSEELRLLYVALTRARDTLLLVGTDASRPSFDKEGNLELTPLNDVTLLRQRNCLGWLKLWMPELVHAQADPVSRTGRNELASWTIYAPNDTRLVPPSVTTKKPVVHGGSELDEGVLEAFQKRFAWRYPHDTAMRTPAKASVTALRRRKAEEEDAEAIQKFRGTNFRSPKREGDATQSKLSAAEIGTAHHTFLQLMSLACAGSEAELRQEAERLREEGVLMDTECAALNLKSLAQFWNSEVGRQIRAEDRTVRRELPFTVRFSPSELKELGLMNNAADADEFVVVQGVADLAVLRPKEIWLLDFKTDRVTADELEEKLGYYTPQLKLYALALEKIYNRPVTRRWLHFFDVGKTVMV